VRRERSQRRRGWRGGDDRQGNLPLPPHKRAAAQ
jgi:hypothetical protein